MAQSGVGAAKAAYLQAIAAKKKGAASKQLLAAATAAEGEKEQNK